MSTVSKSEPPGNSRYVDTTKVKVGRRTQMSRSTRTPGASGSRSLTRAGYYTAVAKVPRRILQSSFDGDRADTFAATVRHRRLGERGELEAESAEHGRDRWTECAVAAVRRLEHETRAVRQRPAEQALGASLGHGARNRLHENRVRRTRAANQLGVGAHRVRDPLALRHFFEPREHRG